MSQLSPSTLLSNIGYHNDTNLELTNKKIATNIIHYTNKENDESGTIPRLEYLKLKLHDTDKWILNLKTTEKTINISRSVFDITWVACYAYYSCYIWAHHEVPVDQQATLRIEDHPFILKTTKMLQWAFENWLNEESTPWPDPTIGPSHDKTSDGYDATQLSYAVISFMIHHEKAHYDLRHTESSIQAEHEADSEAALQFTKGLDESSSKFIFRSLGVSIGLALLTAHGIHREVFTSKTHPRSFDRLFNTLDNIISEKHIHHPAWCMASTILKLHLLASEIQYTPKKYYKGAREHVDHMIDRLAELE